MPEFYIQRQSIKKNPGGFMEQTKKAHAVFSFLSSCRHPLFFLPNHFTAGDGPTNGSTWKNHALPLAFKPSLSLKWSFLTPFFLQECKKMLILVISRRVLLASDMPQSSSLAGKLREWSLLPYLLRSLITCDSQRVGKFRFLLFLRGFHCCRWKAMPGMKPLRRK
jgi:hypothetical protein